MIILASCFGLQLPYLHKSNLFNKLYYNLTTHKTTQKIEQITSTNSPILNTIQRLKQQLYQLTLKTVAELKLQKDITTPTHKKQNKDLLNISVKPLAYFGHTSSLGILWVK
jgi:hypothetical protein